MMDLLLSIHMFFDNMGEFGRGWDSLLPLTILAVITAIIIHTVILMFARAFSIRDLEMFAMSEIMQTGATAFMAIFLVTMVGSAMVVAGQFVHGTMECGGGKTVKINTGEGIMKDAYDAIVCKLHTKARALANVHSTLQEDSMVAFKFNILNLQLSIFGLTIFSGNWVGSLYKETETYRVVNMLATNILISLNAQSQLIQYLSANMLDIFVPLGILLRSFFFTRGPGALMISLGIGMYFISPVFYVLLDPGFIPAPPPPPESSQVMPSPYCYATMSGTATIMRTLEVAGGQGSSSSLSLGNIKNDLAKYYVDLMLHPLIAFFLTLVFIRYLMTILGGDTYELTKMVSKVI